MNVFSKFKQSITTEREMIVHIGSASIVVAHVERNAGRSKIVACHTSEIPVLPNEALADFEREMEKALTNALTAMTQMHLSAPDTTRVFFSSPWYASQVRIARMTRPTAFVVTKDSLDDIVSREIKAFRDEEMQAKYAEGDPLYPLESQILQVKLNGYPTASPTGVSARELELSLFLSVASERMVNKVKDIVQHQFAAPVVFGTFLSSSFLVTRAHFPHEDRYWRGSHRCLACARWNTRAIGLVPSRTQLHSSQTRHRIESNTIRSIVTLYPLRREQSRRYGQRPVHCDPQNRQRRMARRISKNTILGLKRIVDTKHHHAFRRYRHRAMVHRDDFTRRIPPTFTLEQRIQSYRSRRTTFP